jgi:hypothetical protein
MANAGFMLLQRTVACLLGTVERLELHERGMGVALLE